MLGNNMFAYCLNNPVNYSDPTGQIGLLSVLGAIVGGAIAGAVISTVSYVVSSAINNQDITSDGLVSAATTGAVSGGIGGAIGSIFLGSSAISLTATVLAKGMASAGVGVMVGTIAAFSSGGSLLHKFASGFYAGFIAAASTFGGSLVDTGGVGFFGSAFTNFAVTLAIGTPAEIINTGFQQAIISDYASSGNYTNHNQISDFSNKAINRHIVEIAY